MKGILIAMEARICLMIREGKVRAVATTDEAAMGYYVVKWLSKPFSLQEYKEGMSGVISAGVMVVDALFIIGWHAHHFGTRNQRRRRWLR